MTRPALSVVVPSVRRDSVVAAVDSVLDSVRRGGVDAQVIVAWQGDGPPPELHASVEIVPALPAGVSVARNAGLARASANIVAYFDDDETVGPDWADAVLRAFGDSRVQLALGQVLPADGDGLPYCEIRIAAPRLVRGSRRAPWDMGTGGNMALRREALLALGGFDVRLGAGTPARSGEDTDVIARLQADGAVIALWPDMVAHHPRKSPEQVLASRIPYGRGMGVLARRHRAPVLVAHFAGAMYWAVRSRRGARDLAQTARGWIGGIASADRWRAPAKVVDRAPQEIRAALGDRSLRGLPVSRGPLHLVYAAGDDRLLHVRAADPARAARGIAVQRSLGGHPGVPRVLAAADGAEAQWTVEERMPGRPVRPHDPRLAAWFGALARVDRGPVHEGAWWSGEAPALAELGVARAIERLRDHPAAPSHGSPGADRAIAGDSVSVTGWDEATADAPAGLDVVALALGEGADIGELLDGGAARLLAASGLPADHAPALLAVALAHLVAAERRRACALGTPPAPARYAPLLARWTPRL